MFEFKHDLTKIDAHLAKIERALSASGVNSALDVTARKLAEAHRDAFDDGGHHRRVPGGPEWVKTHPKWAEREIGKPGYKPLVWLGDAQKSVRQMGRAVGGAAYIGALDYIGVFQFGPKHATVPVKKGGKDWIVVRDEAEKQWDEEIHRMHREVFYVHESDWNPFMQHIARTADMLFTDVGSLGFDVG